MEVSGKRAKRELSDHASCMQGKESSKRKISKKKEREIESERGLEKGESERAIEMAREKQRERVN